ncbi:MAG: uroporphyrinogen-III synthase [Thermoguttaceae bacterium]
MKTVLITRAAHQAESLAKLLRQKGFDTLKQPVIDIVPPESWCQVDNAIRRIYCEDEPPSFDWIIFSSCNGVEQFAHRIAEICDKTYISHRPRKCRIATVGTSTAESLTRLTGYSADFIPDSFTAEGLLAGLANEATAGKHFLIFRANKGRTILRETLEKEGGVVTEIVIYRSVHHVKPFPNIVAALQSGKIDWTLVTSSEIAISLVNMFGEMLRQTKLVSISPITSQTLQKLGFPPHLEATTASMEGIVNVIETDSDVH